MAKAKEDALHVRANVRATKYSDPVIFEELLNTPAFYRSRRLLSLAELGLQVERGQLSLVTVLQALQNMSALSQQAQSHSQAIPATQGKQKSPILLDKKVLSEEDVHYPGAGNTNVNFESVFGPME